MTIKAVILDVSGTLIDKDNQVVPDVPEMIKQLDRMGIAVFTASNARSDGIKAERIPGIDDTHILWAQRYSISRKGKGSKDFVQYVQSQLGIHPNEILYLGDGDKDMHEAVNSGVIFFLAGWVNPGYRYGIEVQGPVQFANIVETFFLKTHLWYYVLDSQDSTGRNVRFRALLDPDTARDRQITNLLKSKGTRGRTVIKGYQSADYLSLHLLASIYLEGLHMDDPVWCVYPNSDCTYTSVLDKFLDVAARLFRDRYCGNLICRGRTVPSSRHLRKRREQPLLSTQLRSIYLNPAHQARVSGRPVIVVDDFTTESKAFETARNFLLNAGASSVMCIAVGKYGNNYTVYAPKSNTNWDSFVINPDLEENDFFVSWVQGTIDRNALGIF